MRWERESDEAIPGAISGIRRGILCPSAKLSNLSEWRAQCCKHRRINLRDKWKQLSKVNGLGDKLEEMRSKVSRENSIDIHPFHKIMEWLFKWISLLNTPRDDRISGSRGSHASQLSLYDITTIVAAKLKLVFNNEKMGLLKNSSEKGAYNADTNI